MNLRARAYCNQPINPRLQSVLCNAWFDLLTVKTEIQLTDTLDLMVDEFKRIRSCPGANDEIKGLCDRAIRNTYQHVPVIVQRDNAEREALCYRVALQKIADETLNHHEHNPVSGKTRLPSGYTNILNIADAALNRSNAMMTHATNNSEERSEPAPIARVGSDVWLGEIRAVMPYGTTKLRPFVVLVKCWAINEAEPQNFQAGSVWRRYKTERGARQASRDWNANYSKPPFGSHRMAFAAAKLFSPQQGGYGIRQ